MEKISGRDKSEIMAQMKINFLIWKLEITRLLLMKKTYFDLARDLTCAGESRVKDLPSL